MAEDGRSPDALARRGVDTGIVEFHATYLVPGGGVGVQQERSRFVREGSRWYYLGTL